MICVMLLCAGLVACAPSSKGNKNENGIVGTNTEEKVYLLTQRINERTTVESEIILTDSVNNVYNENGQISKVEYYENGQLNRYDQYIYDSIGNISEVYTCNSSDGIMFKRELTFDAQNKLTSKHIKNCLSNTSYLMRYSYLPNGLLSGVEIIYEDGDTDHVQYVINENGMVECFHIIRNGGDYSISWPVISYKDGEVLSWLQTEYDMSYTPTFSFDNNGRILQNTVYSDANEIHKAMYTYDMVGNMVTQTSYSWERLSNYTEYSYDTNNQLVSCITTLYNADGINVFYYVESVYSYEEEYFSPKEMELYSKCVIESKQIFQGEGFILNF